MSTLLRHRCLHFHWWWPCCCCWQYSHHLLFIVKMRWTLLCLGILLYLSLFRFPSIARENAVIPDLTFDTLLDLTAPSLDPDPYEDPCSFKAWQFFSKMKTNSHLSSTRSFLANRSKFPNYF